MASPLLPGVATNKKGSNVSASCQRLYLAYIILLKMEIDRAQTDLGEAVNAELSASKSDPIKEPKKRFIGRKAAAEKAEKNGGSNGTIEDSGAIQGLQIHDNHGNY